MRKSFPVQHKVLTHCHLVAIARQLTKGVFCNILFKDKTLQEDLFNDVATKKFINLFFWNFYLIIFFPNLYSSSSFMSL